MDTPDHIFFATSNAAAAAFAASPAFANYRVDSTETFAGKTVSFSNGVSVRLSDERAIVRDVDSGSETLRSPFPTPPNFDALARFTHSGVFKLGLHGESVDYHIGNIDPFHYDLTKPPNVDTYVAMVKDYVVSFAPDSSNSGGPIHLALTQRHYADGYSLQSIWVDPATLLPTRVDFAIHGDGRVGTLSVNYAMTKGSWLVSEVQLHVTWSTMFGHVTGDLDSHFTDYSLTASPPDPRLQVQDQPAPAPTHS
jgi:hypothetical protein